MPNKRGFAPVIILLIVLVILAIAAAFYLGKKNGTVTYSPTPNPVSYSPSPTTDVTVNWKTYVNNLWKFSIKYPGDKLVACSPNDKDGLRLWTAPFDCPVGHDIFYEFSAIGYKTENYKQYKTPTSTQKIMVAGKEATMNNYTYDSSDGPLQSEGGSTEILIPVENGLIQLNVLGNTPEKIARFNQILSTFKFTQ